MVRRRLFARMGLLQAAALAASQPGETRPARDGARTLRHGGGDALTGVTDPRRLKRSICAMGHKWMWNPRWGGLPAAGLPVQGRPALRRHPRQARRRIRHLRRRSPATSPPDWAERLGLKAGIPIPVGAFDAHWDAIGAGCRVGDVVNVVGTSTCIIAMAEETSLIQGVCGVVPGSVDPHARRASRPASRPPATSSRRSPGAPAPTSTNSRRVSSTTAPARPACCA